MQIEVRLLYPVWIQDLLEAFTKSSIMHLPRQSQLQDVASPERFQKSRNLVIKPKYLTIPLEISAEITRVAFFVLLFYFQLRVWLTELIYLQMTFEGMHLLVHTHYPVYKLQLSPLHV